MPLSWTDSDDIAALLLAAKPDVDPLTIRFPDLIRWVNELDGFDDAGKPSTPKRLEDIQRSWYRRYDATHSK